MSTARSGFRWLVSLAQALLVAALAVSTAPRALAQDDDDPPSRVARLGYLRGTVSFQPAGESEWGAASPNRPLTTGDRLWTEGGARAELNTGSATIRLDGGTDFGFLDLDDRILQMELTQGTVTVHVRRLGRGEVIEVDTPNQAFSILEPGTYRVEAGEDGQSTLVTVRDGAGEASGGGDTYTIQAGQSARFTGTDRLDASLLLPGRPDEFEDWGMARERRAGASPSARYVSHDVVGYEDLDDYGTWGSDPSYGHVWTPTRVPSDWAPYRDGHWAWIAPWGYTWVDDAPWGFAPFHYGRWVTVRGRWGWVPGPTTVQAVYAPALVAFIGGPGFGLSITAGGGGSMAEVAWFPLGPREVYVPGYHVSRAYVDRVNVSNTNVSITTITNVYSTQVTNEYRATNVRYVNRTAPGAVTVVPQQAFTGAQPVARAAVKVNMQRLEAAPIGARAAAAPTRNSVYGVSRVDGAPRPPPAVANRAVVARRPPPPPPVPFTQQQQALAARPGQPLARKELERVRQPAAEPTRPQVRQAPPGKPAKARDERAQQGQPAPQAEPPKHEAQPARQAEPPKREAQPARQPEPPKREAQPDRQAEPPRHEAQPARQAEPPKREAQPARQPEPPKREAQPARQPEPPKREAQPARQPEPPKREAQPARQAEPPKREAQPARQAEPPKREAQPTRQAEPPKREAQPARQVEPPKREPQPARQVEPPTAGKAERAKQAEKNRHDRKDQADEEKNPR